MDDEEARLEAVIRELVAARADDASICPSEVARRLGGDDWRELMAPARAAAARLAVAGEVEVTQGGVVVDAERARGPVRIRRAPSSASGRDADDGSGPGT